MAKIERTYNPDAVLFGNTNKGMNYSFTPHSQFIVQSSICLPRTI